MRRQWQRNRLHTIKSSINALQQQISFKINEQRNLMFSGKLQEFQSNDPNMWSISKLLKNKNKTYPPFSHQNGILITDEEKANALGEAFFSFHKVSESIPDNDTISDSVQQSIDTISNTHIEKDSVELCSANEIGTIIRKLKKSKSPGFDNFNNKHLKNLPRKALVFLSIIFNACFMLSYFPDKWKHAKVIGIPKPGKDKSCTSNYRPISLLSVVGKILEKLIKNRLNMHVESKNIIPDIQFGFRAKHSTSHQIFRLIKYIKNKFKLKKSTGMMLFDIEKAFDSVWHDGLFHKLLLFDFPPYLIKIVKSFLENRSFQVSIKNCLSKKFNILRGLPQGSAISPILYNIFVADIPILQYCDIAGYADDTCIFTSGIDPTDIINKLENAASILIEYFNNWKIKINKHKTQCIFFSKRRAKRFLPERKLKFINEDIGWQDEVKYLGFLLDKKLLLKKHIDYSINKASNAIRTLYPLINRKSKLSLKNKTLLYSSCIRSLLTYGSPILSNFSCKTNNKKLQIIQNKCLKLVGKLPRLYSTKNLHKKFKIPYIDEFMHKLYTKFKIDSKKSKNELIVNLF
jgi:hypothetical protein